MKHLILIGEKGVGKSTAIRNTEKATGRPFHGFLSKLLKEYPDEDGLYPIYIYPYGGEIVRSDEYYIGCCNSRVHYVNMDVFDIAGCRILDEAAAAVKKDGGVLVIDELGFMESSAEDFKAKVLECLSMDIDIIVSVKNRVDIPFLMQVRATKDAILIPIDEENRGEVTARLTAELSEEKQ